MSGNTREGKKCIAGYFHPSIARALNMNRIKRDMKLEALLIEIYTGYLDQNEPGWREEHGYQEA